MTLLATSGYGTDDDTVSDESHDANAGEDSDYEYANYKVWDHFAVHRHSLNCVTAYAA